MEASRWADLDRPPLAAGPLAAALLAPAGPLARLEVLAEVGSTNTELVERARADPGAWPHLSALVADHQVAGRGRLGRTWTAPPRTGVHLSVLLRPDPARVPPAAWGWYPLLAGLAVARVVREVGGLDAAVKWPNDVLVGGRKVSGVLAEAVPGPSGARGARGAGGAGPAGLVVGVGVNTALPREQLPVPTATSLRAEGARTSDRGVVLRALVRALAEEVAALEAAGGDAAAGGRPLAARVAAACSTLGQRVRVELPGGAAPLVGTAVGLAPDGRLRVTPEGGGADRVVAAGDVVHLRGAGGAGGAATGRPG